MKLDVFLIDGKWKARIADDILPQEWDTEEQAHYGLEEELRSRGIVAPVNTTFVVSGHPIRWINDALTTNSHEIGRLKWNHLLSRQANIALATTLVTEWLRGLGGSES